MIRTYVESLYCVIYCVLFSIHLTDLGWVELTYSGGDKYTSHCGSEGRVSRIFFFCDSSAGEVSGLSDSPYVLVCAPLMTALGLFAI